MQCDSGAIGNGKGRVGSTICSSDGGAIGSVRA